MPSRAHGQQSKAARNVAALRAVGLTGSFFLVMLAYYQVKPASRSLFLEHLSAQALPYLWIASALMIGLLMPLYQRCIQKIPRVQLVVSSIVLSQAGLVWFWYQLDSAGPVTAVAFAIFTDIISVVLVEQVWSLANSSFVLAEGRRWYGLVASGGLLGGMVSGGLGSVLLSRFDLPTSDLLMVAVLILVVLAVVTIVFSRVGLFVERQGYRALPVGSLHSFKQMLAQPYLLGIAGILLTAQLIAPVIEYQFLSIVEVNYPDRDPRTAYLAGFFALLSACALATNLVVVPVILRQFGTLGGLLVQPLLVLLSSLAFMVVSSLPVAALMKISDRGLSYSINRVSRELLYVPVDGELIYKAKAWIDMFGYRLFRILGSLLIKLFTVWLPWSLELEELSWITVVTVALWVYLIARIAQTRLGRLANYNRAAPA